MLIRNAELPCGKRADVRIANGHIVEIGEIASDGSHPQIDASGGLLLPGLHDHHIHLAASAVAQSSIPCGPPEVCNESDLARAIGQAGGGWLRGIGYHESVAGDLCRSQIDEWQPDHPVRIQHRSGRMWFFNSAAVALLRESADLPDSFDIGTGSLFDADDWLRSALAARPPELCSLSEVMLRMGVTGVTEISPSNGPAEAHWLADEVACGRLRQRCVAAGSSALQGFEMPDSLALGPLKLHLHENALPDFDVIVCTIAASHRLCRPIAVHCTTEVELVFALSALGEAGAIGGDRIEHAGMATDTLIEQVAEMNVHVVSQPHFIAERGDQYLASVPHREQGLLYRLQSFDRASVVLAAGSDAPYGSFDPWASMRAACARRTRAGTIIGADEALSPEQALSLYLADPLDLSHQRRVVVGGPADLCLLDRPWREARDRLEAKDVRCVLVDGALVYDRIDKAPFESFLHPDASA